MTWSSTDTVGRLAAEFLLDRPNGGHHIMRPDEYATHVVARTLPAKAALYYSMVGVLEPVFGPENAVTHIGPRAAHACMVAMAINCWQVPTGEEYSRGERAQMIAKHLRLVYTQILHDLPSAEQYERLQWNMQNALRIPLVPEDGMGDLAQAIAWVANLKLQAYAERVGAVVREGQGDDDTIFGEIRALASRIERGGTAEARLQCLDMLGAAVDTWPLPARRDHDAPKAGEAIRGRSAR